MDEKEKRSVRFRRVILPVATIVLAVLLGYRIWSPGIQGENPQWDQGQNGIWLGHGWLGDDGWFARNHREPAKYRGRVPVRALVGRLKTHGITELYPHLCPAAPSGKIPPVSFGATEDFLDEAGGLSVLPWVGGVLGVHCFPESLAWRQSFVLSVADLLAAHPRLAGIHLNIEPLPSGNVHYLRLLDDLKRSLPAGKILSVAAYPPFYAAHPFKAVHWDEGYFRQVAGRADQMAVMMYDTGIRLDKLYVSCMAAWTRDILDWGRGSRVLLGVPAYDDAWAVYHDPGVENLENALSGIFAGLAQAGPHTASFQGVALYSEWEMDTEEWALFQARYLRQGGPVTDRITWDRPEAGISDQRKGPPEDPDNGSQGRRRPPC